MNLTVLESVADKDFQISVRLVVLVGPLPFLNGRDPTKTTSLNEISKYFLSATNYNKYYRLTLMEIEVNKTPVLIIVAPVTIVHLIPISSSRCPLYVMKRP